MVRRRAALPTLGGLAAGLVVAAGPAAAGAGHAPPEKVPLAVGAGGGGFLVYHDAATGEVSTIDGREAAPLAMGADAFLAADGTPLPFQEAVQGGLSGSEEGFVVDRTFRQQTAAAAEPERRGGGSAGVVDPLPDGTASDEGARFAPDLGDQE
jgi:gamma-glutamyltranspeptidase/glutathione hydrolase